MMMRVATTLVVLGAAVYTVSASAGGATNDPTRLVLQRSDFPANTHFSSVRVASTEKALAAAGFQAKVADYVAEIPRGRTETLIVRGRVVDLADAAQARRLFAQYKQDLALNLKLAKVVRLPAYG